ncbi:hypothetical protein ACHRVW_09010 [Flavobacterium collinsii]|uniref:hypothetical protein n=1 Tax=Flavobacterium collinsii TaxID=1114861 RepID=UPI0037568AF9
MYDIISQDFSNENIHKNISIESHKTFFEKAKVFPVYHIELSSEVKPVLVQNKDSYLVIYVNRFYVFFNDDNYMLFENRPEIKRIKELIENKKEFMIAYFTSFNYLGEVFNILITDNKFSFVLERDEKYLGILEYIDYKYGSFEKYKEKFSIEKKRNELTLADLNKAYKVNYSWYERRCPKDTTLILKKYINQIKLATSGLSKEQEIKLTDRIKSKLHPTEYFNSKYYKIHGTDLELKSSLNQNKKGYMNHTDMLLRGDYNFYVYGIDVTQDLLEILTDKQFLDYKNYNDLFFPIVDDDNLLITERYSFGIEVFKREVDLRLKSKVQLQREYNKYFEKEFGPFDCPFDETIKRELIIR